MKKKVSKARALGCERTAGSGPSRRAHCQRMAGFTLVELLVVMAIVLLISAMAMPMARNSIRTYRLNAASSAISGAIQSTRYQSIMVGCPYTMQFTASSINYQIATQNITGTPPACATSYTNVGSAVPWSTSKEISISADVTLTFNPSGTVTSTQSGAPPTVLTINLGGMSKVLTVSGVGNVSVISK